MGERELLVAIVAIHPRATSQEGLDDGCFYCGEWQYAKCGQCDTERHYGHIQRHANDCLWVRACELLGVEEARCEYGHENSFVYDRPPTPYKLREPSKDASLMARMTWRMEGEMAESLKQQLFGKTLLLKRIGEETP